MANYWEAYYISWNDHHDGTGSADSFKLHGGNDTANGLGGADTFYDWGFWGDEGTSTGNDNIDAGSGNDTIFAGDGTNSYNGGSGLDDTIKYQYSTSGVTVNLTNGTASSFAGKGSDTLYNIEHVVGSKYGDTLTGDGENNQLLGEAGRDTLNGGGGEDRLRGGIGGDELSGNGGLDSFIYTSVNDSKNAEGEFDLIRDFQVNSDELDLSQVSGIATFVGNIGANGGLGAGQVGFYYDAALDRTIVEANVDGDSFREMHIEMSGNKVLTAGDIVL
jgi:Ca2+-binding RTX toxin-like protein